MRVAVVGLGLRAGHVLSILKARMPEMVITGYCDPGPVGLDKLGGEIPVFASVEALIDGAGPDLLFVGSPNHMHLAHITAGLNAGLRVFAEKPVVISEDETFALAELLQKHGSDRVLVGLVLRYSQHMRDLRASLSAGHLGRVISMEANEHIAPYHGAFFMRDWRRKSAYSGGFMLEKCCHDLDIYNMVAQSRPSRVASFGGRGAFVPDNAAYAAGDAEYTRKASFWEAADDAFSADGDIVDNQTAILEYESGARLAFHTNTNVPDEQRRFCIVGTQGMAEGDFVRGYLNITDARSRQPRARHDYSGSTDLQGAHYGADEMMCADIVDYLRGDMAALPVSVVDALEAGLAAMAIDRARFGGSVVDLTDIWNRLDTYNLRQSL